MTKHLRWIFFGAALALLGLLFLAMLVFPFTQNSSQVSSNAGGESNIHADSKVTDDHTIHITPNLFGDPLSDMRTYSIPLVYSYRGRIPPRTSMVLQGIVVGSFGLEGFLIADASGQREVLCEMSGNEFEDATYYYKRGESVQIMGKYSDGSLVPVMRGCTMSSSTKDVVELPNEGLPKYIADALSTPDLAPGDESPAKRELVLGSAGQKQIIPAIKLDEDCGASSCSWNLLDADTQQMILPSSESGGLYKTQKITNGYYDILVLGGTAAYEDLSVYEYSNGKYNNTTCYKRSANPDGPWTLTSCQ